MTYDNDTVMPRGTDNAMCHTHRPDT